MRKRKKTKTMNEKPSKIDVVTRQATSENVSVLDCGKWSMLL